MKYCILLFYISYIHKKIYIYMPPPKNTFLAPPLAKAPNKLSLSNGTPILFLFKKKKKKHWPIESIDRLKEK